MLGGIYSDQYCPVCGRILKDMGEKLRVCCPEHPEHKATRVIARLGKTQKRFSGADYYLHAKAFIGGIQAKIGAPEIHGEYDPRDYRVNDAPIAFNRLADQWLDEKEFEVNDGTFSKRTLSNYKNYMKRAQDFWRDKNVKLITGREIKLFLFSIPDISSKTRHNYESCLHAFWTWLMDYDEHLPIIKRMPKFPRIKYELGFRTITTKAMQLKVLDKCKELYPDQPRRWIGVQWLIRYPMLRPDDLLRIQEKDVNYDSGLVIVRKPTKLKLRSKGFYLLEDDIELLRNLPRGMPDMPLFRHDKAIQYRVKSGQIFGNKLFYKTWKKACGLVGLEGVDLYGGTRHTTTTDLQDYMTPDEVKKYGTQHAKSNKAFDRYFFPSNKQQIRVSEIASGNRIKNKKGDVLPLKKKRATR